MEKAEPSHIPGGNVNGTVTLEKGLPNKGTQTRKEEVKLFLFSGDIIFYTENLKGFTKKLLELINEYSKVSVYKTNMQKSVVSCL